MSQQQKVQELQKQQDNGQLDLKVAFTMLAGPLRSYCLFLGADEPLADDIVQETFGKLVKNYHDPGRVEINNVKAWLYKVAYDTFVDAVRKSSRETFYIVHYIGHGGEGRYPIY